MLALMVSPQNTHWDYPEIKIDKNGVEYAIVGDYIYSRLTMQDYEKAIRLIASELVKREPASLLFRCTEQDILREIR